MHGVRDGFPSMSVFTQQDANQAFYPSIPNAACWTTWHRVFATPEDFSPSSAAYKDYVVKLTASARGAGTGTVTIKLIDNDADNYRTYRDRCR